MVDVDLRLKDPCILGHQYSTNNLKQWIENHSVIFCDFGTRTCDIG